MSGSNFKARLQKLTERFSTIRFDIASEERLLQRLIRDYRLIQSLFAEIRKRHKGGKQGDPEQLSHLEEYSTLLISQMMILSQQIISQSFQLHDLINQRLATIRYLSDGAMLAIITLFTGAVLGISWRVNRNIKVSSSNLLKIAHQVSAGNLNYSLTFDDKDEFRDVYLAFRYMTAQLTTTYEGLQQEIEQRRCAEEALREHEVQLKELNASKDKFFSIIGHDLTGPLGSFYSLMHDMVERFETFAPETLYEFLQIGEKSIERLYQLLENLLTWSRIQRGALKHVPQPFPLAALIEQNLALLNTVAERKTITLRQAVASDIQVFADWDSVDAVIRNLMANAIKFTPARGTITLRAIRTDQSVEVTVSDTGVGIAPEYLPELFQIDSDYRRIGTDGEKGTGLGLILCKEFVEREGGQIWCESELGAGTTFRFTLPEAEV